MSGQYSQEPMLDMYIFETTQLIEQLEQAILSSEKTNNYSSDTINEIFRIMHTIKGSSAMMLFNNITALAHSIEDLFFFIRELKPPSVDYSNLSNLLLIAIDFIQIELTKIANNDTADGNESELISSITKFLEQLKRGNDNPDIIISRGEAVSKKSQYYISQEKTLVADNTNVFKATIYFEEGCEMENIRSYTIIYNLRDIAGKVYYTPEDIIDNDDSVHIIREKGFQIWFKTDKTYEDIHEFLMETIFIRDIELVQLDNQEEFTECFDNEKANIGNRSTVPLNVEGQTSTKQEECIKATHAATTQSMISVSVAKLDALMDLVGEMVISEAMVTQNPDLRGLNLENFSKAARQLRKITGELQDMVMSIRMVPLSTTFHKMHRIVRDMSKKLEKEIELKIIGEETEVDKNIIEHISDPLMHLVRNSIDHGIESTEDRIEKGKSKEGTVTLEAKNAGSEVHIIIKDDGKGLNKNKILERAKENNLIHKSEDEMTDKDVYSLILLPGFSTKDGVTEFSGRGVGMDVVTKNIEIVGGTVSIDSMEGVGTTITLKIPLTLAIIDGMNISVGKSRYTLPTNSIVESFRPKESDIIIDPDGNELIMVRNKCYPILRLHELYGVETKVINLNEGIVIMVEDNENNLCIFADELLGQQQVVVKTLPNYIKQTKKIRGLAGCTLLGDGGISLIIDIAGLMSK